MPAGSIRGPASASPSASASSRTTAVASGSIRRPARAPPSSSPSPTPRSRRRRQTGHRRTPFMIESRFEPINILLVEDNPADARLTAEGLKRAKVLNQLHVVEDGEEAI